MCVVLNDIHIDIMDYILPASCTDAEFRQMWAEFEWENKVCLSLKLNVLHFHKTTIFFWKMKYIVSHCYIHNDFVT